MKNQSKAYIYALSAVLLWSTVATAFKFALNETDVETLLFVSSLSAAIVLFLILIITGKTLLLKQQGSKDILISLLAGLINPFLYYLVLFKAYNLLPAQTALSLNYSWAVMIVIFSIIFLKQKISYLSIAAILISFIGLIVIATEGNFGLLKINEPFGISLALGSSLLWASFWIINLKDQRNEIVKLFMGFSFGFLMISIYMLLSGSTLKLESLSGLLSSVYIGLFEMGITFLLWFKALKLSVNTAKVSSLAYLSPLLSLNFISLILGEKILLSTVIGITLIVGGVLLQKRFQ